jgi:hypothetical protein
MLAKCRRPVTNAKSKLGVGRGPWSTGSISVEKQVKIDQARNEWVEPEVRELDVRETFALPRRGADIGGNPAVDCQFS